MIGFAIGLTAALLSIFAMTAMAADEPLPVAFVMSRPSVRQTERLGILRTRGKQFAEMMPMNSARFAEQRIAAGGNQRRPQPLNDNGLVLVGASNKFIGDSSRMAPVMYMSDSDRAKYLMTSKKLQADKEGKGQLWHVFSGSWGK